MTGFALGPFLVNLLLAAATVAAVMALTFAVAVRLGPREGRGPAL